MLHTNDINVLYYIKLLIEYINSFMLRWTKLKKRLKNYDFLLMITPILLAAFGVVMIYSASMVTAVADGLSSTYYLFKQLQWFILGLIGFVVFAAFPYRKLQRLTKWIVILSVISLIYVIFFGETVNQAQRAINLFGLFNLQPAEFVKLGIIIYLASIYAKKQDYIEDFSKAVIPPLILVGFLIVLILLQPDIGTAGIIIATTLIMISCSGFKVKHLVGIGTMLLLFIAAAIPIMATDNRLARITGAYQPFSSPETDGYHLVQSYLAIGSSGLSGEGLGQSIQKLGYLWGAHTDFIMSIIAEELGMIGVISIIGLMALVVLRGLYVARYCDDQFGTLLAVGISSMIGVQAFINLSVTSGLLPITGVPLPFISYGGSSLIVLMISMGILNNIAKDSNEHFESDYKLDVKNSTDNLTKKGSKNYANFNKN